MFIYQSPTTAAGRTQGGGAVYSSSCHGHGGRVYADCGFPVLLHSGIPVAPGSVADHQRTEDGAASDQ